MSEFSISKVAGNAVDALNGVGNKFKARRASEFAAANNPSALPNSLASWQGYRPATESTGTAASSEHLR